MTPLEFISFCHAQPFRPFRIYLKENAKVTAGSVDVTQPLQLAMSPNMQTVMLATDESPVSFKVEAIERCEWLDFSAAAPASIAPPETVYSAPMPDSGTPSYMTFSTTDGHRVVAVSIDNRDGRSCFTTAGTRYDIHGFESFENGCSLYLHHLDHPMLQQRIIIWPASKGTFESFSEAMDFNSLYKELKARDQSFISRPVDFTPPESYFRDIVPRQRAAPPRGNWWEKDEPDAVDRFIIKLGVAEVGPHHWASSPRIIDTDTEDVLFDLWDTRWDLCGIESSGPEPTDAPTAADTSPSEPEAPTIRSPPPWTCELRHFPEGSKAVTLRVNPKAGTAAFNKNPPQTLSFFERTLKNYDLYERWDWLQHILSHGPCAPDCPMFRHALPAGYMLELWPGPDSLASPFVQLRVMEPGPTGGRVLLDLRGSVWAADVRLWENEPKLVLDFLTRDNQGRSEYTRRSLILDLPSRRVTCERIEGSTSIGVLHNLAQTARTAKWFLDDLAEAFTRGKPVPLP